MRYAQDPDFRERRVAAARRFLKRHRERYNASQRHKYAVDPEFRRKRLANARRGHRKAMLKKYGLTVEDYRALQVKQDGACAICGAKLGSALCVDHCHACGMVRGLLCLSCNTGLGHYRDDRRRLHAAVAYLALHHCSSTHAHAET